MAQTHLQKKLTDPLETIRERARANKKRIVFPESDEPRTLQAAQIIQEESIADVILIGDKNKISTAAKAISVNVNNFEIVNPTESKQFDSFVSDFLKLREKKQISKDEAQQTITNPLYFSNMMVRNGLSDASIAGAVSTTGDVIRAAVQTIGLKENISSVSSCFLMIIPEYLGEKNKVFLYADCGVIPEPTPEQLADTAAATSDTMRLLFEIEPKVALLSFSTKGSANHESVNKVTEALKIMKSKYPQIKADGELQVDAAIVPEVAARKSPQSEVAGKANILIFPDLDAGNIAYKLTERLANAKAIGPILQGLAKPASDLSRGCSVDDIVDASAIASVMAE